MAEEKNPKGNVNMDFNNATTGLNQDNTLNQIKKGSLTYALNAAVENYDSNSVNYQNEPGNKPCFDFPKGYSLIAKHLIPERNKILFFLANPVLGASQIGYMENNDCVYKVLACSDCLNFSIYHPIQKIVHRVSKEGTEIFWADNNGRRYMDIDNLPRTLKVGATLCDPEYQDAGCDIDCGKLKLQPNFTIPLIKIIDSLSGGDNTAGTVQFAVQYSDANSNPYTSYYGITNPTPIADKDLVTVNFNYPVGKSIVIDVNNLDVTGQFQYFNLAVIKTVNSISTPELVGTYFIDKDSKQITYTGQNKTQIQLAIEDIFEQFPYYDGADYVTAVQDILVWSGLTAAKRGNYQSIFSKVDVQWETHRVLSDKDYSNEVLATNKRGYMRDEVYALEGAFLLTNGKVTDGFHIPGKIMNGFEISAPVIYKSNPDFIGSPDPGKDYASYWRIYNTAKVSGQYSGTEKEDYEGPYQYGEMAFWESSDEYPCNKEVWGNLVGQKIRHHKFPDNLVSPIFESEPFPGADNLVTEDRPIFPIGIKIDPTQIRELIAASDLTEEEKNDIVGFKIFRGDRGVNKSVIAKGMLRNVNKYTREEQDFFYPNYPYNDVQTDPFISSVNNAWIFENKPWVINILKFNLPLDTDGNTVASPTYAEVEYKDPNTNKTDVLRYTTLGEQKIICSTSRPQIQGPGEKNRVKASGNSWVPDNVMGTVRELNYDIWRLRVRKRRLGFYRAGYRARWTDPIEGTKERWIAPGDDVKVWTVAETIPVNISGGKAAGNQEFNFESATDFETDCGKEEVSDSVIQDLEELAYRQVFNSPDTSFGQPFLGSILKLETVIYGPGSAHFVQVKNNAKYRLLTEEAQEDALTASKHLANLTNPFNAGAMFTAYQAYLEIYVKGITRKNYAYSFNSIASYNYSVPIPNDQGIKQRMLDIKKYLISKVQNVGEKLDDKNININNYNRETSVYLRTVGTVDNLTTALPLPHNSPNLLATNMVEKSRFTISGADNCSAPGKEKDINVISYYASLKNEFINQYGQMYSYTTIDTGHTVIFGKESLSPQTIFGGDTFIGRFAYKTKLPFFIDNRVGAPDDSDIFFDEIGNIAYPRYWHSARSILSTYSNNDSNKQVNMYNMISAKAHNFDCPNSQGESSPDLLSRGADPADNPDRTYYDGYMYLFAYGIPSFYCESSYNLDLRTAFNNREGDFWPHVSSGIPDDWLQEDNVSILNDNTYNYNVTFSKQNKESFISHLPEDWDKNYLNTAYPFRAVYSDIQNTDVDNRVNNWLTYRALSYFDFPQNNGALIALDGMANKAILARFENKSLLYNALITIDTSNPQAAYVGNPKLFSTPPIDFADTDLGYVGCQNKMLLKIPQGAVFADAKRGQIFLVNGTQAVDLTGFGSGMNRFFMNHLSFKILKYFPGVDTDNHFNGVGLHGVYDSKYERIILTKLDYIPLNKNISYSKEDVKFYLTHPITKIKHEIFLTDEEFFCNKSFTISFNFNTNSWISFHSYIPNWYIGENDYFYSGLNACPNDFDALVGIMLPTFKTTTTTTTRVIIPTTTTTTTLRVLDCEIVVDISIPACDIAGTGIIIYTPIACKRPSGMERVDLISGYSLEDPGVDADTTASSDLSCNNLGYYIAFGGGVEDPDDLLPSNNYTPKRISVESNGIFVYSTIYLDNGTNDCEVVADGWYFTDESSADNNVFHIVNGKIVEIIECGATPTTTTTTTQDFIIYCFRGIYSKPDPIHPLGGVVSYIDKFGDYKTITGVWDVDSVTIEAVIIINKIGVENCADPITTTTTTSSSSSSTTTTTTTLEPTTTTTTSSSSTSTTSTSSSSTTTTTTTTLPSVDICTTCGLYFE